MPRHAQQGIALGLPAAQDLAAARQRPDVVYLALDTRLGREVALELLPAALAADPGRLLRFGPLVRRGRAFAKPESSSHRVSRPA